MLCDAGARPWGSRRPADVVGMSWDASLVVPCPERRGGGGGGARTPSRRRSSSSTPSTRRLFDGVVMPVPHRSTEPGRPRHRREMTGAPNWLISTQLATNVDPREHRVLPVLVHEVERPVARGGQVAEALFQFGRRLEEQLDARRPQRARELRRRPQRARELRSHYY